MPSFFSSDKASAVLGTNVHLPTTTNYLTYQQYEVCSQYILKDLLKKNTKINLIIYTLRKKPHDVHMLMVILEWNLKMLTRIPEKKLLLLFCYALIFDEMRAELIARNDADLTNFFIRDIIHTICNQIDSEDNDILLPCLCYFEKFCRDNFHQAKPILAENFVFIFETLINKRKKVVDDMVLRKIRNIITLFTVTWSDEFSKEVTSLPNIMTETDSLHVVPESQVESQLLTSKIEQFLNTKHLTHETLTGLEHDLGSKKEELISLYQNSSSLNFSDDSVNSPLHRLVNRLLHLVRDTDATKSLLASRCIGELGAYDLSTLALVSQQEIINYEQLNDLQHCRYELYKIIIRSLPAALIDTVNIKMAASQIAAAIFRTTVGRIMLESYPSLKIFGMQEAINEQDFSFFEPTNNGHLTNIFVSKIDSSYEDWMQNVVENLLMTLQDSCILNLTREKLSFAEDLFPVLVKLFMCQNNKEIDDIFEKEVNLFFTTFINGLAQNIKIDKLIVKTMLLLLEYHRIQYQVRSIIIHRPKIGFK